MKLIILNEAYKCLSKILDTKFIAIGCLTGNTGRSG